MIEKKALVEHLSQFVLERRLDLFKNIISYRTRYITVVLEDVFQAQNASAVLRTCECFGIQDIHMIQNKNKFKLDKEVTMGSDKWLNLHSHKNTLATIKNLRSNGYRIIATAPGTNNCELFDLDLKPGKLALLFGTELTGLSEEALSNSDELVSIPIFGFTESYNLSVSVALTLQYLVKNLHDTTDINWKLSENEYYDLLISWLRKSIRKSDIIEKNFLKS